MGRLLYCAISLASSWSLWDVQLILRAVIGFNWKWRNSFRHCTCFRPFHDLRGFWPGKSICIKFACLSYHSFRSFYMVDGGKSCCRSSERKVVSTPPLRADFTQQSSPRSSHGPLRKTNIFHAFLQEEVSHRFIFTHKTYWLFNCWLYGIGIRFSPNNLNAKPVLAAIFYSTYKLTKLCKNCGRRKFVNTWRSCQEKCSKIVKLVTNYKATLVRFLYRLNRFFTGFKTPIYSKKCFLQLLSKRKQVVSSDIFCIET